MTTLIKLQQEIQRQQKLTAAVIGMLKILSRVNEKSKQSSLKVHQTRR